MPLSPPATVRRLGLAAVKGTRHTELPELVVTASGPLGDRRFAFCAADGSRVLRTVANPDLVAVHAEWRDPLLSLTFPDGTTVTDAPAPGAEFVADYWGRDARLRVVQSAHAAAMSAYLGTEVVLAQAPAGDVVYGGAVTVVTTSDLIELAERAGDPAVAQEDWRFRATVTVDDRGVRGEQADTDNAAGAGVRLTNAVPGALLRLGEVVVRVRGRIPRCAVIDIGADGRRDRQLMSVLAGYRRRGTEVYFGLDCAVHRPGRVRPGDRVSLAGQAFS